MSPVLETRALDKEASPCAVGWPPVPWTQKAESASVMRAERRAPAPTNVLVPDRENPTPAWTLGSGWLLKTVREQRIKGQRVTKSLTHHRNGCNYLKIWHQNVKLIYIYIFFLDEWYSKCRLSSIKAMHFKVHGFSRWLWSVNICCEQLVQWNPAATNTGLCWFSKQNFDTQNSSINQSDSASSNSKYNWSIPAEPQLVEVNFTT